MFGGVARKFLLIDGATGWLTGFTTNCAVAVLPVREMGPRLVPEAVTWPVTLVSVVCDVTLLALVTLTVTVQLELAGMDAPDSEMLVLPAVPPLTEPPVQVVEALGGFATFSPFAPRLSLMATPVNVTAFELGLVMFSVRVEAPPSVMEPGLNDLLTCGGLGLVTVRLTVEDGEPVPPSFEDGAPVVLGYVPGLVPTTLILMIQSPPAAIVPLLMLRLVLPAVLPEKLALPQPVAEKPGVLATCIWPPLIDGKASLKLTPVCWAVPPL